MEEIRAHLHASPEWTNIPPEVVRLFAHGAGTGVFCTEKVSLRDATICVVASNFLWPLWLVGRWVGISHFSQNSDEFDVTCRKDPTHGRNGNCRLLVGNVGFNRRTNTAQIAMLRWCDVALADDL